MTIIELIELLSDCPPDYTIVDEDSREITGIEFGRDFIGQRDIVILLGE